METVRETLAPYEPQGHQNGHRADSDAPEPIREWYEAEKVIVHLVVAKRRGNSRYSAKVGELHVLDAERKPVTLFANVDCPDDPWGSALRAHIETSIARMEAEG